METSPSKRRKLGHPGDRLSSAAETSTLELAASGGLHQPRTFILETDELLRQEKLDYNIAFPGAGDLLLKLKTVLEGIETHQPAPVRLPSPHLFSAAIVPAN